MQLVLDSNQFLFTYGHERKASCQALLAKIAAVEVKSDYKLRVLFGNGQSRVFDLGPYLNKGIFKELRNQSYFRKVRVISGGVEWPHEQDLSADTLYYRGIPLKRRKKSPPRTRR